MQPTNFQTFCSNMMQFLTNHMPRSNQYTKVTMIHHQTLSKKDTSWKIDVNSLSVLSLQGLLLLFIDKRDDFANKNKDF